MVGTTNSSIFSKYQIPPAFDVNCFSILTKNTSLDLRHEDEKICKSWCVALSFLAKKARSMHEVRNKKIKELSNRKEIISDFWRTEILPKWKEYRNFIIVKGQNSDFLVTNSVFKKKNKFYNLIFSKTGDSISNTKNRNKIANDENSKQDVVYLWALGVPDWLRKKLWALVLTNSIGITENLFNCYIQDIETHEFTETVKSNLPNGAEPSPFSRNNAEEFEGVQVVESNKMTTSNFNQIQSSQSNEITVDVNKCFKKFEANIKADNIEEKKFKDDLYRIVKAFTKYRLDVQYTRQIAYIASVLYLNSEDFYQTFVGLTNFMATSYCLKFMNREEAFVINNY